MTAEVMATQSIAVRELGLSIYNLITPKLEGIPDTHRISEQSKIRDFRDHVAQEPGLYLAAWQDGEIRSLLRFKDRAVVDAFWDHYYGNVLLAVRELVKSYQFPNLTFEAAYREINTVLADLHQMVGDKKNEETNHGDNGHPQVNILIDDGREIKITSHNGSFKRDGEPAEIAPVISSHNGSLAEREPKEKVDRATVVKAQTGDRTAFEVILQHYWNPIYNFVYRMMGHPEDAFDFSQVTFMKAYEALPSTSPDLKVGAWLYKIAYNACLDEIRHRGLIHWLPWESFISVFHPSQVSKDNPERDVLNRENQEEILAILDRLHPKYRRCLILYYFQGLSYGEIAATLSTTVATVKSLLDRAREKCRQVYARTDRKPALPAA